MPVRDVDAIHAALDAGTPLALMMGQIVHEVPVGPLLVDRAVETLIGCGVALVVLLVVRDPAH